MKVALILLAALSITGCSVEAYNRGQAIAATPEYKQCEYQADLATPSTRNAFEDGMRRFDLIQKCMALKSSSR